MVRIQWNPPILTARFAKSWQTMWPCNDQHKKDRGYFHRPQNCLMPCSVNPPPAPDNSWPFCGSRFAFSGAVHMACGVLAPGLRRGGSVMPPGRTRVRGLSLCITEQYSIVWICHDLFFHSPDDGHLGCFQCAAIKHEAAVNTHVQVFVWTCCHFP